jgi:hypothetical protein
MDKKQIEELKEIAGDGNVLTEYEDMLSYSYDSTRLEYMPDAKNLFISLDANIL